MEVCDLDFAASDHLRLLEAHGRAGSWSWSFADGVHRWSPGLYALLGIRHGEVRASYEALLRFVHPEDRLALESPAQVRCHGMVPHHAFRVIRPDGDVRTLSSRNEILFAPEGRPRGAIATLFDSTEERSMAAFATAERVRWQILARRARIFMFSERTVPFTRYGPEFLAMTGLGRDELADNWVALSARDEWSRWQDVVPQFSVAGRPFTTTPAVRLAEGGTQRFWFAVVPVRNEAGVIEGWTTAMAPMEGRAPEASGAMRRGLEQAVGGTHLRAARALLDWTMMDLAGASGLSFSTIRRLEENAEGPAAASRHRAVAALRAAGIRFSLMGGNAIAVARS